MYGLCAFGNLDDNTKSTNPAENPNPATQLKLAAINTDIAVKIACTKYSTGATNINANSIGSVTPVKNEVNPAANIIDIILFLFSGLAVLINAAQAPNRPNIIIGKNPA